MGSVSLDDRTLKEVGSGPLDDRPLKEVGSSPLDDRIVIKSWIVVPRKIGYSQRGE